MAKPLVLSIPDAAKALGVSERTVYRRVTLGMYPTRTDPVTGKNRIAISHLRRAIISAKGKAFYDEIKGALERGEVLFHDIPVDSRKCRKKPKAVPKMKAPVKTKAKPKAKGKKK